MPFNVPPVFGAYDAVIKGMGDSNALAKQRADAILAQIKAQRENEVIDAELLNNKLRTEAYAKQVAQMNLPKTKLETEKSKMEAEAIKRSQVYAALNSLYDTSKNDVVSAASMYNSLKERGLLPEDLTALEGPEATFNNPGQTSIMSNFRPEALGPYLEGMGRPKEVAQLQTADINRNARTATAEAAGQFGLAKQALTNQGNLDVAKIRADADKVKAAAKAGQMPNYEKYLISLVQAGVMTLEEAQQELIEVNLTRNPAAYKPGPMQIEGINREPSAAEKFRLGGGTTQLKADPLGIR